MFARELRHPPVGSEVQEAPASVGEKAIIFHALANANAKPSRSLPDNSRLRGAAIGSEKVVLPEDKFRIQRDVFVEIVIKPEA